MAGGYSETHVYSFETTWQSRVILRYRVGVAKGDYTYMDCSVPSQDFEMKALGWEAKFKKPCVDFIRIYLELGERASWFSHRSLSVIPLPARI